MGRLARPGDAPPADLGAPTGRDRRPRRKRPGRFRRWVLRPVLWSLALFAVALSLLQFFLDSPAAREWARAALAARLTAQLERPVTIRDVSFVLLPFQLEVWGLTVAGVEPQDPPLLEVPWALIEADLATLQHQVVRLRQLRLERPSVYLGFFAAGGDNLLRPAAAGGGRRFDLYIDRLEIEDAQVVVDQERIPLTLAADQVVARLDGRGEMNLRGEVRGAQLLVRLPGANAQALTFAGTMTLDRDGVEVEDARLAGPTLSVESRGDCAWRPLRCTLSARGRTRGAWLAELGYFDQLRGAFDFDGTLAWRPGTFGWRGRVQAPRIDLFERVLSDLDGVLIADRYGARLGLERAGYAGGTLAGTVSWDRTAEDQPVSVDLSLDGLWLDDVLRDQSIGVEGLAARLGGAVRYRFARRRPRAGDGSAELRLTAPPPAAAATAVAGPRRPAGLALAGAFPVRIAGGVIQGDAIALRSPAQSVLARGWYDLSSRQGRFDYQIASADIGRLARLLPVAREGPRPIWLPTAGSGRIEGALDIVAGRVASDLRLDLLATMAAFPQPQPVRGALRASPAGLDQLRLELGDGDQALLVGGRVPFAVGGAPAAPLSITADAVDWPLENVRAWLPFALPIDGRLSGRLALVLDPATSGGTLDVTVRPATLLPRLPAATPGEPAALAAAFAAEGIAVDTFAARLRWDAGVMAVERLAIGSAAGTLTGGGDVDWRRGTLDLRLRSPALALQAPPVAAFMPRTDLRGGVAVEAWLHGSMAQPQLALDLEAPSLALGDRRLDGSTRLAVRWDGDQLRAEGRLLDLVSLSGGGALDRARASLAFAIAARDLSGLAELLAKAPPAGLGGAFEGTLAIAGDLAAGVPPIDLTLDRLTLEAGGRTLTNLEPVTARLGRAATHVASLYLAEAGSNSELFATGDLSHRDGALDFRVQSNLDTAWLVALWQPTLEVAGQIDLLGRLGGTLAEPFFDGQGALRGGSLLPPSAFPHTVEAIEAVALFYPDAVVLDHLRASLAGGSVRMSGRATLPRRGTALGYSLRLAGRGLDLRYPADWSLAGDADLTLASTEGGGNLVSGRVDLTRAAYRADLPIGFDRLLQGLFARQRLEVDPADETLAAIELNVVLAAPGGLRMRNNLADLSGDADVVLRGTLARPLIYGTVDIDPGSKLVYNSTDYEVARGRLTFAHPTRIDPEVDLLATTRVREFDVNLSLSGTLDRLDASFSSEPPLPDVEVFRLLATGEATDSIATTVVRDLTGTEPSGAGSAASFLYGQAASVIGDRVNALFGFDKFRIDPLTGSGDALSKTRVTVGKRLSKDLFVTYSADPASTEDQRLQVEWQVGRGLVLVLTQNGDDTYSADARWEHSF